MATILIIDDEESIRNTLREILEDEGYTVEEARDGHEGIRKFKENYYDLILCDMKMPKKDGMEVFNAFLETESRAEFIILTAYGTIENAVDATKKGAFDFIEKPPDLNRLLVTIRNALDKSELVTQKQSLQKKVEKQSEIIGESEAIQQVREDIQKVAPTDARVLISGPNGSGKELVAQAIHKNSPRKDKPLIEVNCAAIPSELIESELFGHEKGAFTTAVRQKAGKFEQANGGTLFLDEIGDMSLSAQAKVLRTLQEHKITRVGGEKEIKTDVRVLAASNKDLDEEIAGKNFREDLYHRLSVIIIRVPSLDERKEDIPLLVDHFLKSIAREYGEKPKEIDNKAMEYLKQREWPGNIRELRNIVERLIIMSDNKIKQEDVKKYC